MARQPTPEQLGNFEFLEDVDRMKHQPKVPQHENSVVEQVDSYPANCHL